MDGRNLSVDVEERAWLTVPERAAEPRVPRNRCYELIQQGSLPTVRIGERSIHVNQDVERFFSRNRRVVAQ